MGSRCVLVVMFWSSIAAAQLAEPPGTPQGAVESLTPEKPVASPEPVRSTSNRALEPTATSWWARSEWWLVVPAWLTALVALALALYTARLWAASARLLKETQEIARRELRAYVGIDEIFFTEPRASEPGTHTIKIRNFGQTPGYRLSIWCERASHLPQEGVKPFYDAPLVEGQLLQPVQAYTVSLAAAPLYRIGKPGFFTYGRLVYHDTYGKWWVTRFCFRYEGDGNFVPHGDYNHEDGPFDARPA